jgi:hypothetical protein
VDGVPVALWTLGGTILVALVDGVLLDGAAAPLAPLAAVTALLALAVLARVGPPAGPGSRPAPRLAAPSQARSRRRQLSRATDPDAAGRPRPRAPSAPTA